MYGGEKTCLRLVDVRRALKSKTKEEGFHIKKQGTGVCLGVSSSSSPWDWGDKRLAWKPDCNNATLWLVELVNTTDMDSEPKMGESEYLVKVTDKESRNCVTVTETGCLYSWLCPLAVIKECSPPEEQDQQMILLTPYHMTKWAFQMMEDYRFITLTPKYDGHQLKDFSLIQSGLRCERLNVTHGTLLLDPSQPIHTPGETIPVLCDTGYGVRTEAGFSQYFTTVCSNDLVAPKCVKFSQSGNEDASGGGGGKITIPSNVFYSIVSVVSTVILCLVIGTCCQRIQIQRMLSSENNDEVTPKQNEVAMSAITVSVSGN